MALATLTLLIHGCKKPLTPVEYVNWINDESNGLTKKVVKGNFEVSVQYRPSEYMALLETRNQVTDEATFLDVKKQYEGSKYFVLKLKKVAGQGDPLQDPENQNTDYYTRLKYFSEDIKYDLYVISDGDTMPCKIVHLERTYKLTPYTNLLLAFDDKKEAIDKADNLTFVYEDRVLELGKLTFDLSTADLKNSPEIKF